MIMFERRRWDRRRTRCGRGSFVGELGRAGGIVYFPGQKCDAPLNDENRLDNWGARGGARSDQGPGAGLLILVIGLSAERCGRLAPITSGR